MKERRLFPGIPANHQADWQWQIRNRLTTVADLDRFFSGSLSSAFRASIEGSPFPMGITPYYAGLIDPLNPDDPLTRQVVCHPAESVKRTGSSLDPLAEVDHSPVPGLIHRYKDRALLMVNGFCPVFCRFCLRKRAWSQSGNSARFDLSSVLNYISEHSEIRDVILSGGDPFLLPLDRLAEILEGIRSIPHVRMIRIGSRSPTTLPMRIDVELLNRLQPFAPLWIMTHFNHPREVTVAARTALSGFLRGGMVVSNQTVLLRGVNDNTATLIDLSVALLEAGVRPYYLHQLDRVTGAEQFHVPIEEGISLVRAMFGKISGLGIPRYTLDLPGGMGKIPLMPDFMIGETDVGRTFESPLGGDVNVSKE